MSWIEQIQNDLIIRTGDGKGYQPEYINPVKDIEYNVTEYDFPEVEGTLVKRKKVRGTKYTLNLFFTGENHLDIAKNFEISARDERSWTIQHPHYGQLIVQPLSLAIDDSKFNTTQIVCVVMETIEDENPRSNADEQNQLLLDRQAMNAAFIKGYEFTYVSTPESKSMMLENINDVYDEGKKDIDDADSNDFFVNLYNQANASIVENVLPVQNQIMNVNEFITSLAFLPINAELRIAAYKRMFDGLPNVFNSKSEAVVYENNAALILSSMAISAITPLAGNYKSRIQVVSIIDLLYQYINIYLSQLDQLQASSVRNTGSYVPNYDSMFRLTSLINKTIASLFKIALGAKQERIVYLDKSSNLIVLTHRFYGLDVDDANIEYFKNTNKIGLSEILNIKKGRKIVFYL